MNQLHHCVYAFCLVVILNLLMIETKKHSVLLHFIVTFGDEEGNARHEQLYGRIMHNMQTMITECMQLVEQKHAK